MKYDSIELSSYETNNKLQEANYWANRKLLEYLMFVNRYSKRETEFSAVY